MTNMDKLRVLTLNFLFLVLSFNLSAQGWIREYGGSLDDRARQVIQTADNGFLVLGDLRNPATGQEFNWIKTDENGILEWTLERDNNFVDDVVELADGSFIAIGTHSPNQSGRQIFAIGIDAQGNELWFNTYGNEANQNNAQDILASSDGNFFILGRNLSATNNQLGYLVKIDAQGVVLWEKNLDFWINVATNSRLFYELDNGDLILAGTSSMNNIEKTTLTQLDANANTIWQQHYDSPIFPIFPEPTYNTSAPKKLIQTDQGYFLLIDASSLIEPDPTDPLPSPYFEDRSYLIATDINGNITWDNYYFYTNKFHDIELTDDNHVLLAGKTLNTFNGNSHMSFLRKIDLQGNQVWESFFDFFPYSDNNLRIFKTSNSYVLLGSRYFPLELAFMEADLSGNPINTNISPLFNASTYTPYSKIATNDQGFLFSGASKPINNSNDYQLSLIKMDQNGNIYTSTLSGKVHIDENDNCQLDNNETNLENWLVKAEGELSYFARTNSAGEYFMELDTGNYQVSVVPKNDYWQFCDTANISVLSFTDSLAKNFGAKALADCPFLEVDVSTAFLRRCFPNTYVVQYCNTGTQMATNASIEVILDDFLQVDSSSIPISSQVANTLNFDIGDVPIGACEKFWIYTTLDCDSTFLGQTHCVEAYIYPDTFCILPSADWNGASVNLDAQCIGDSVLFRIQNEGTGPMLEELDYFIVVDDVILRTGKYQLDIGETKEVSEFAGGATLRMEAMQVEGHPGNSQPSATVEACANSTANISIGFVTQFGEDDGDPFVSIDCQENIGSFDPNDKRAYPKGFGEEHFIYPNQDLEYIIRFQNTGTDTAFKVVIIDTISPYLDLSTFREGASSHSYELDIYGNGIVKFTFEDIMLPDSNVNQLASNGFVKFKIAQQLDNPIGTNIFNSAAIYFDFNKPILTNQTYHLVGDEFVLTINSFDVTGNIRTIQNEPIGKTEVNLTGFQSSTMTTASEGLFQFSDLREAESYTIEPYKNINADNGVTSMDLVLMSLHLLEMQSLDSPFLRLAADVDMDGAITVYDLLNVRRVILHLANEFPANATWRFFHQPYSYPQLPEVTELQESFQVDVLEDHKAVNFIGIKLGDLNYTADPNNLRQSEVRNATEILQFKLKNPKITKGQTYTLWFSAENFQDILAYQFSLKFDPDALQFRQIKKAALSALDSDCFGLKYLDKGIITTSWYELQAKSYSEEETLFALEFVAKQNGQLSDFLQLSRQFTPAIAYSQQQEPMKLSLAFEDQEVLGQFFAEVYPNPTQQTSHLNYKLYKDQEVQVVLYNSLGQVVQTIVSARMQKSGDYQYPIDLQNFSNGTYIVKIITPEKEFQQRIIKLK